MFHFRSIFALSFVFVATTSATADQWTLQNYPDDKFQVEWSGPTKISPTDLSMATDTQKRLILRTTQYMQDSGTYVYAINAQHNRNKPLFDKGSNDSMAGFHCKTVVKKKVTLRGALAGTEMIGTDCENDIHARARYFLGAGNWYYQVITALTSTASAAEAEHFLGSFKITAD